MRTFEDIIPPSRRPGGVSSAPPPPPPRRAPAPRRPGRFPYAVLLIAVVVIGASAAVLVYFSGARIEITPSVTSVPVEGSYTAGPAGDLPFTLVTAKKTGTVSIPSTGTKQASDSASGPITIYNTKSKPQTLVANTRFATPAGLIYRIHKGVVVPAGKGSTPGSVAATAYADAPGAMYDIGPTSFTIPGLAGSADASAVYARSTSPMIGGAAGPVPIVDAAAEKAAVATLEASMAKELSAGLAAPDGSVLLPGAATTTYHELAPAPSQTAGKADIVVEATASGVALPAGALASAIASSASGAGGATLGEGTKLTLTPSAGFPAGNGEAFSFALSGTALLVAKIDAATIATAVAGKSREEAQVALANYPEVKRAVLVLRPFWKSRFPEDPSAITVTTTAPATP